MFVVIKTEEESSTVCAINQSKKECRGQDKNNGMCCINLNKEQYV